MGGQWQRAENADGSKLEVPNLWGEVVLGLDSVTEGKMGPPRGGTVRTGWGCGRRDAQAGRMEGGGTGWGEVGWLSGPRPLPRDCMQAHTWGGSPPPCPLLGAPLWVLRGCGLSSAPGALCRAPDLCVHRRIRGLGGRGVGGGASSEPQRGSQGGQPGQASSWATAQAGWRGDYGRVWTREEGAGRRRGDQEAREDRDPNETEKDGDR